LYHNLILIFCKSFKKKTVCQEDVLSEALETQQREVHQNVSLIEKQQNEKPVEIQMSTVAVTDLIGAEVVVQETTLRPSSVAAVVEAVALGPESAQSAHQQYEKFNVPSALEEQPLIMELRTDPLPVTSPSDVFVASSTPLNVDVAKEEVEESQLLLTVAFDELQHLQQVTQVYEKEEVRDDVEDVEEVDQGTSSTAAELVFVTDDGVVTTAETSIEAVTTSTTEKPTTTTMTTTTTEEQTTTTEEPTTT
jgi:hypothetical protein